MSTKDNKGTWIGLAVVSAVFTVAAAVAERRRRRVAADALTRTIPLFKVFMAPEVDAAVLATLHSGYVTQGPQVEAFEAELRGFFGNPYVLTTNSCTSSTHLAFRLLERPDPASAWPGFEDGDEVLTSPLTCTATNWPALANGLGLRWVDVDPNTVRLAMLHDDRQAEATILASLFR
jgi:dTDP-4-amino-4,6-dideoxygalactose transaminase